MNFDSMKWYARTASNFLIDLLTFRVVNFKTSHKPHRSTNNRNKMAEVVNKLFSKDIKQKNKISVLHYLNEKYFMDELGSNYQSTFITFVTCVHHNNNRFLLFLMHQLERGMLCEEVQFVTQ